MDLIIPNPSPDNKPNMKARIAHRQAFVLKKLIAGYSTADITILYNQEMEAAGLSEFVVEEASIVSDRRIVLKNLQEEGRKTSEEYRAIILERHEFAFRHLYSKVENGNLSATKLWLAGLAQLAEITGVSEKKNDIDTSRRGLSSEERREQLMRLVEIARQRRHENLRQRMDVIEGEILELNPGSDGSNTHS